MRQQGGQPQHHRGGHQALRFVDEQHDGQRNRRRAGGQYGQRDAQSGAPAPRLRVPVAVAGFAVAGFAVAGFVVHQ
jgi:hypothetical protein